MGLQIALEFMAKLVDSKGLTGRQIHVFTDCQAAIAAAFGNQLPKSKVIINSAFRNH